MKRCTFSTDPQHWACTLKWSQIENQFFKLQASSLQWLTKNTTKKLPAVQNKGDFPDVFQLFSMCLLCVCHNFPMFSNVFVHRPKGFVKFKAQAAGELVQNLVTFLEGEVCSVFLAAFDAWFVHFDGWQAVLDGWFCSIDASLSRSFLWLWWMMLNVKRNKTRWSPRTRMPTRMLTNRDNTYLSHLQQIHLWDTLNSHTEATLL